VFASISPTVIQTGETATLTVETQTFAGCAYGINGGTRRALSGATALIGPLPAGVHTIRVFCVDGAQSGELALSLRVEGAPAPPPPTPSGPECGLSISPQPLHLVSFGLSVIASGTQTATAVNRLRSDCVAGVLAYVSVAPLVLTPLNPPLAPAVRVRAQDNPSLDPISPCTGLPCAVAGVVEYGAVSLLNPGPIERAAGRVTLTIFPDIF
jgi:hypothetical protein